MLTIAQLFNPLGADKYKVITDQARLNDLVHEMILPGAKPLKAMRIVITRSRIHIRGIVEPVDTKLEKLKSGDLHFNISLTKQEVRQDEVFLNIKKFKIYNLNKHLDLYRIINRYSAVLSNKILNGLTSADTPFRLEQNNKIICFDLKFILSHVPSEMNLLGKIKILNIAFDRKKIIWYLESNVVLKSIIDYLGPKYAEVEKMDEHSEALRLLTDLDLEDE